MDLATGTSFACATSSATPGGESPTSKDDELSGSAFAISAAGPSAAFPIRLASSCATSAGEPGADFSINRRPSPNLLAALDIIGSSMAATKSTTYKDAGVNIDEADRAVAPIKTLAQSTFTRSVLTDIGSFGGGFLLTGYKQPVLVSSADGVGTKLKVAFLTGRHDTIGEDLVNHCVNDIAVQGARAAVLPGLLRGGQTGRASGGGSGLRHRARLQRQRLRAHRRRDGRDARPLRGRASTTWRASSSAPSSASGLLTGAKIRGRRRAARAALHRTAHQRLFAGAQAAVRRRGARAGDPARRTRRTLGDELLKVHRSYLKPLRALMTAGLLKGAAHITGGGITDNTPRMLPEGLGRAIDTGLLAGAADLRTAAHDRQHPGGRLPAHVQPRASA